MDSTYASGYAELYRSHWWWRSRERLVIRKIARWAPPGGWQRALDVGCGDGLFLPRLSDFAGSVEGLETDDSIVSEGAARAHTIHIGGLDDGFKPGYRYDFISMLNVLEHIEEPLPALRRAREILSPGGILVVTVPAFQFLWTSHDDVNHHHLRYTRRGLTRLVLESGFEIEESRYFFHWLTVPKWAIGQAERRLGKALDSTRVPRRTLNSLLYGICRAEQAAFAPFPRFPGSSLLLVGTATPHPPNPSAGTSAAP